MELRRRRFQESVAALAGLFGELPGGPWDQDDPLHVAIIGAGVDKARRAMADEDVSSVEDIAQTLEVASTASWHRTAAGALFVVDSAACESHQDERGARCFDFLTPSMAKAATDADGDGSIGEAVEAVVAADMLPTLSLELGICIFLEDREPTEATKSYAVAWLPSVVHVDRIKHPIRLGELLLHEATHCLFNDLLAAYQEALPDEPRWYSPWSKTIRPAAGVLHGAVAFSSLMPFYWYHWEHASPGSWMSAYMEGRLRAEFEALRSAERAFFEASEVLGSEELRSFLHERYRSALEYGDAVD